LTLILGILAMFVGVLSGTQKYRNLNQGIAISGFEKYRNVLISLSQTNWPLLNSLTSTEYYYIFATSNSWQIATGSEKIISGNEVYNFSFKIGDYLTNTIKFITTTAKYENYIFEDYFLLPKINTAY
jgi:hypothetical protein